MEKERVDLLVVQQGITDSREKAKRLIMAGQIVDAIKHTRYDKPGEKVPIDTQLLLKGETLKYVSRGGLKLEKAVEVFAIEFNGKRVLDIGASTGGFTDVALRNGAKLVYALDVGYNQLDYSLRQDERVIVMERTNFRYCQASDFAAGAPQLTTIDVSFISLRLILPVLYTILSNEGEVVMLIKPQFEAGRERVGKKGIVSDPKTHQDVVAEILNFAEQIGFYVKGLNFSPITGGTGNIEFLAYLQKTQDELMKVDWQALIPAVVKEAHLSLKNRQIELY